MWLFRKKDNSTWGQIYMPWTYASWIRAYVLVKDALPKAQRAKWEKGLLLGFNGISKTTLTRIHNIPCYDAMALYIAGVAFKNEAWKKQAWDFERKVIEAAGPRGLLERELRPGGRLQHGLHRRARRLLPFFQGPGGARGPRPRGQVPQRHPLVGRMLGRLPSTSA